MAPVGVQKGVIAVPALDMPKIKGMGSTFFDKMSQNKDDVAQICGLTGQRQTFGELLQNSTRTAIKMRSEGLTSEDIISICTINHLNSCVPYLAGLFLDIKTASLDPSIPLVDTIHLIKQVNPKMIFVGLEGLALIEKALEDTKIDTKIVVFGETSKHLKFSEFLQPSPEETKFVPKEVDNVRDTAVISFSSGTTGLPKGICLSHYCLIGSFYQTNTFITRGDVILTYSPMYWLSLIATITHCTMNSAARLIYPKYDPVGVWDLIKKFKVSAMVFSPAQLIAMCRNGYPEGADISSLKIIRIGGSPLSGTQILEIRKSLPDVIIAKAYGQSELSGGVMLFKYRSGQEDIKLLLEKPESSGTTTPGFSYKVVNPDTDEILGPHEEGELRIKSEFQMNGYYHLDSSDCWDSDGFIKTGDVAYYDKDNCFYIVDRIKELLKYQNWHVQPAKLEGVLVSHPAVESAVVVGLPHPVDGDHPLAIVILKQSVSDGSVTAEELEKFVEERVDDRLRLRGGVKIVKSLPFNLSGKFHRRDIKAAVLRGEI